MPATAPESPPDSARNSPPDSAHDSPPDSPTDPPRVAVSVGVLQRHDRRLLVAQRMPGTPCAGQWEFPGGKVEPGETPRQTLARELREELGIEVLTAQPLLSLPFDYPHARVWLEVFVVARFQGTATGCEGQPIRWLTLPEIRQLDILQAVPPILDALEAG